SFVSTATSTVEIYTLSLHDALPIWWVVALLTGGVIAAPVAAWIVKHLPAGCWVSPPVGSSSSPTRRPCWGVLLGRTVRTERAGLDRKSTRLNSSHVSISYAVFCLKR